MGPGQRRSTASEVPGKIKTVVNQVKTELTAQCLHAIPAHEPCSSELSGSRP